MAVMPRLALKLKINHYISTGEVYNNSQYQVDELLAYGFWKSFRSLEL